MELSAENIKEDILKKHSKILNQYPNLSVYIFGASRLGRRCAASCTLKGIQVLGFIDNAESLNGKAIDGIIVYSLQDYLDKGEEIAVIIASLNYWDAIDNQLRANGITLFLHYCILTIWDSITFPACYDGFSNIVEELCENSDEYYRIRALLADAQSRQILDELLRFRAELDISCTRKAYLLSKPNIFEPYFDFDIISLHENEIFVDGGAYLGETSEVFIKHMLERGKKFEHIFLIEPDNQLLDKARAQMMQYSKITYCAAGLSDVCELSGFDSTGDTGGAVNPEGNTKLFLETIDKITNGAATFIKLDIEGYEDKALFGAAETIMNCKPKIAISAYHKCGDIWKLWTIVNNMRNDYKVYLRHYTPGAFDTVLYFV